MSKKLKFSQPIIKVVNKFKLCIRVKIHISPYTIMQERFTFKFKLLLSQLSIFRLLTECISNI